MGASDKENQGKDNKASATTQEHSSATSTGAVNPDWSGFQAYSPLPPPHGFLASSPQAPHPYMWGVQPIMPPYGTPPHPYVAMYPPGGIYAHPSIPQGSYPFSPFALTSSNGIPEVSTPVSAEGDCKPSEVKEKLPIKRCKGSLGNLNTLTGKSNDINKIEGSSANGTYSKSAESRSDGSSEGSDANSQNDSQLNSGGGQDSLEAEASQNGIHDIQNGVSTTYAIVNQGMAVVPMPTSGTSGGVPGPTTNLNIGMDYWRGPTSSSSPVLPGKISSVPVAGPGPVSTGSRDSAQSQIWLQDERELKRQRRKQSNRESARRSRLRKQAECDELALRADALSEENSALRSEVGRIRREYEELLAENASLKERLGIEESTVPNDSIHP